MPELFRASAVVPGYYLVCYNKADIAFQEMEAVVPGYYLVCYNSREVAESQKML